MTTPATHPTPTSPQAVDVPHTGRRVLLKLSGEAIGGGQVGLDPEVVKHIAHQIAEGHRAGVQVAVVMGGGNFFRGAQLQQRGMERARADYMGMLGTVMNCLALQDFLEKEGVDTRVQTAITMGQVAEPYIPRRAIRHLEKGRVVIFGAGAGMPYFSTDTVSAQRALEIKCDAVLMSKHGVDGVYTADPRTDVSAVKLDELTFSEALSGNLRVVDAAAFSLCMDNDLPMLVFGVDGEDGQSAGGGVECYAGAGCPQPHHQQVDIGGHAFESRLDHGVRNLSVISNSPASRSAALTWSSAMVCWESAKPWAASTSDRTSRPGSPRRISPASWARAMAAVSRSRTAPWNRPGRSSR